jgi:hypothetical protein
MGKRPSGEELQMGLRGIVLGKRPVRGAVIVLACAVAALAASAQRAPAAVIGLTQVAPQSASSSVNKGITATCPAGMKVLSAGADATPGDGEVVIDQITPAADLRSVRVRAHEDDTATSSSWFVQAFATCAYPPAGLVRVTAATPSNSASKGIVATCPAGKKLFGIGADLSVSTGQVLIDKLAPNAALTALTAHAVEDEDGTTASWALRAYAICATPIAGMQRVLVTEAQNAPLSADVQVACPAGKGLLGAGGQINGAAGQIVLDAVYSDPGLTTAGFAAWEDETGTASSWGLTTFGICAPRAALVTASETGIGDFGGETLAQCPANQNGYGAGFDIFAGFGQVAPRRVSPRISDTTEGSDIVAFPDQTGPPGLWELTAQSVCATPFLGTIYAIDSTEVEETPVRQTISVTCPTTTSVIAAGGQMLASSRDAHLEAFVPDSTLTSVTARAMARPDGGGDISITSADAQCAPPPPGLELRTAVSAVDSESQKATGVGCPATKHVIGSGAEIVNGFEHVALDAVEISDDLSAVTATAFEDEVGLSRTWSLRVYAICITR